MAAIEKPGNKPVQLSATIQYLKGVGPRLAEQLGKKGVVTIRDALYFFPRTYEDRRTITKIAHLRTGVFGTICAKLLQMRVVPYRGGRRRVFEMVVGDESGSLVAKWFQFNERSMI